MNEQKPPAAPDKQITRIPISKLWFQDNVSLTGTPLGSSTIQIVDCAPQFAPGRAYWVCHFIPAWQVMELSWYKDEKTPPANYIIGASVWSHAQRAAQ